MNSSSTVLVTGGAGYIGSQAALDLKRAGYKPVIIDDLSRGNKQLVDALDVPFHQGSIGDENFVSDVISKYKPSAVMHFAAFTYVGESVKEPQIYYHNNVLATLGLLRSVVNAGIKRFIFSSTAATYGLPEQNPITEEAVQKPINPYGLSKFFVEKSLADFDHAFGLKSVIFRYFNASGADRSGLIGELHDPETHLIPLALDAAYQKTAMKVFGNDYATPDGTCIRDYVHVADISQAHLLGLQWLEQGNLSESFNIGTGKGNSVLEVLDGVESITGMEVKREFVDRRAGDPPSLVASNEKLTSMLSWKAEYTDLVDIISTAWNWFQKTNN